MKCIHETETDVFKQCDFERLGFDDFVEHEQICEKCANESMKLSDWELCSFCLMDYCHCCDTASGLIASMNCAKCGKRTCLDCAEVAFGCGIIYCRCNGCNEY